EQPSQQAAPGNKGKGKAKVTEEDKDEEGEATQKLRKELEDFMVLTKCDRCIANNLADQCWMQKKHPPLEALTVANCVKLVQVAKAFLEQQGKLSQFFVLEGFQEKKKAKALGVDSEPTELVGMRKEKEIIELGDLEDEMVAPKTPVAGPLCQTLKPMILVPSMPKPIPKPIVVLASPVASPSTACIVLSLAPKPTAAVPVSKPAPVKSAGKPAVKGGFVFKDPFMVTKVAATQETLQDEDTSNKDENNEDSNDDEGGKGDDDDSNNNDAAMDIDSADKTE
ncbi:hypothetical protein C0995_008730, partial [Termitomyces sp. Mi166